MCAAITIYAPAKINLALHVTGRRDDGYHTLSSLFAFTPEITDTITLTSSDGLFFEAGGAFADSVNPNENSLLEAARWMAARTGRDLNIHMRLDKALPVAAGIGGGSADAAAVIRGLLTHWEMEDRLEDLIAPSFALGADVPACLVSRALRIDDAGKRPRVISPLPPIYAVLVNPRLACSTAAVFSALEPPFGAGITTGDLPRDFEALCLALELMRNDLGVAATSCVPHITKVQDALFAQRARVVRLSGSGATCFGLFETQEAAQSAQNAVQSAYPEWWVRSSVLR